VRGGVVTERELAAIVDRVAALFGWRRYHTWLSTHSAAGFPDEVLVRGGRLIFAELKSDGGKLRPEQEAWLADLEAVPGVEVHVWRPADLDAIAKALR
jgi:hypothetical protein